LRGLNIRPTSDYVRESIFNILRGRLEGAVVLDLFAGTGSLGIEALSRGAEKAVFVDKSPHAIRLIRRNVQACILEDRSRIWKRNVLWGLDSVTPEGRAFDLVFVDPPYEKDLAKRTLDLLDRAETTSPEATIVVEHSTRDSLPEQTTRLNLNDQRRHGKTLVSFYSPVL
jgi:16S rRNA (guanine966-N2)-methyltransferase